MKRVIEREEDDEKESMEWRKDEGSCHVCAPWLRSFFFVVIFAGDFFLFFAPPLLVYFISVFVDSVH